MNFYSELSRVYDGLFPVEAADMAFIRNLLAPARSVLDLGCGTGNKTEFLAANERCILGVDADPAMITVARARHCPPGVAYEIMDMERAVECLTSAPAPARFDAALVLGNTLPHLASLEKIRAFASGVRRLLGTNGIFVVQVLNYDHVLGAPVRQLPTLRANGAVFRRRYESSGDLLDFVTELNVFPEEKFEITETCSQPEGQEKERPTPHSPLAESPGQAVSAYTFTGRTPLYPLRPGELRSALLDGGFGTVEEYGDFNGGPPRANGLVHLAVARTR